MQNVIWSFFPMVHKGSGQPQYAIKSEILILNGDDHKHTKNIKIIHWMMLRLSNSKKVGH